MTQPPPLAQWLADHARPIILEHYRRDSCIESTAIALDVLRSHGITARELSVQACIFNAPAWAMFLAGQLDASDPATVTAMNTVGAWSVGLGIIDTPMPEPGRFAGHLIALVEEHWILDLSIDQATRLHRGIRLTEPILARVPAGGLRRWEPYGGPDGQVILYQSNETIWAQSYTHAPAWKRTPERRAIVAELLAAYRSRKEAS